MIAPRWRTSRTPLIALQLLEEKGCEVSPGAFDASEAQRPALSADNIVPFYFGTSLHRISIIYVTAQQKIDALIA
jgi:hypothetical protein